jgi:hypothetical protein
MSTLGAVVISRNDNYGGDLIRKFTYTLTSLIANMDEVYYVDWNSPDKTLFEEVRENIPQTGKLKVITITPRMAQFLTKDDPEVQHCVEVLARNIGIRRLSTDYIVSTNSDVMIVSRSNIESNIGGENTFDVIARTDIPFSTVEGLPYGSQALFDYMLMHKDLWSSNQHQSGSPLGPQDRWSLISCCGDFQLAHRNVWGKIRGFEESLTYRGYADSNIQRKADHDGFQLRLVRDTLAYHFTHYPDSGSTGGNSAKWNTPAAIYDYNGTTNNEGWGFSYVDFKEETI